MSRQCDKGGIDSKHDDRALRQAGRGPFAIVPEGTTCRGHLKSENPIHIDGYLDGDIEGCSVVIGETGLVTGRVIAEAVQVMGKVDGEIIARTLRVKPSASVKGGLTIWGSLSVEDGAHIDGALRMKEAQPVLATAGGENGLGELAETDEAAQDRKRLPPLRLKSRPAHDGQLAGIGESGRG